eukprot:CAMPEP_0172329504 /NCGR_PEP_ID=MMETSP1058-20130122/60918_1 /TAXON_ID=83371 /ORGANISM="Detonula confervacea, Strain CCMP 353" /LENGTH=292 /DNA_ID=CAMNT_0013046683 /DNA_START=151 /DNA_END=1029 /DNA_ORIENTATION=+
MANVMSSVGSSFFSASKPEPAPASVNLDSKLANELAAAVTPNTDNPILVVYPFQFPVGETIVDAAAMGLTELGNASLSRGTMGGPPSRRNNIVIITTQDKDRLKPGIFLNDALIDFWMKWISRGETAVCIFTTHFMSTLLKDGTASVVSWTKKKKINAQINVFKQRIVFLPINENLHWSLCVVVNPGLIAMLVSRVLARNSKKLHLREPKLNATQAKEVIRAKKVDTRVRTHPASKEGVGEVFASSVGISSSQVSEYVNGEINDNGGKAFCSQEGLLLAERFVLSLEIEEEE